MWAGLNRLLDNQRFVQVYDYVDNYVLIAGQDVRPHHGPRKGIPLKPPLCLKSLIVAKGKMEDIRPVDFHFIFIGDIAFLGDNRGDGVILRVLKVDEIVFLPGGVLRIGGKRCEQQPQTTAIRVVRETDVHLFRMVVSELYLGKAKLNTAPGPETAIYCLPSNE
jgi:hypothetical protein